MTVTDEQVTHVQGLLKMFVPFTELRDAMNAAERVRPQPQSSPREPEPKEIEAAATAIRGMAWALDCGISADEADHLAIVAVKAIFALHPVPLAQGRSEREIWEEAIRILNTEMDAADDTGSDDWTAKNTLAGVGRIFRQRLSALPTQSPPSRVDEESGT